MGMEANAQYELIRKMQSKLDTMTTALTLTRARLFDLLHPELYNTPNAELKAMLQRAETNIENMAKAMDVAKETESKLRKRIATMDGLLKAYQKKGLEE